METPDIIVGEVEEAIASQLADLIGSGATLQTGIGGVPSAVVELLAKGSGGDYGVHSEMFTTGLMRLHEAGKISNKKGIFDGVSVATFAMGSRELYDWLDGAESKLRLFREQRKRRDWAKEGEGGFVGGLGRLMGRGGTGG